MFLVFTVLILLLDNHNYCKCSWIRVRILKSKLLACSNTGLSSPAQLLFPSHKHMRDEHGRHCSTLPTFLLAPPREQVGQLCAMDTEPLSHTDSVLPPAFLASACSEHQHRLICFLCLCSVKNTPGKLRNSLDFWERRNWQKGGRGEG